MHVDFALVRFVPSRHRKAAKRSTRDERSGDAAWTAQPDHMESTRWKA
jgi:hypothetical protein